VNAISPTVRLPRLDATGRVAFHRVLLSEWTKLRSVRSTKWSLAVGFLLTIAFPLVFALVTSSHWGTMSPHDRADRHPLDIALAGVNLSQLAIGVLGVLVVTGEYSTGMIRASFTAVPKRLPVLWAKIVVFAVVSFVLSLPAVVAAFFLSQAILSKHDLLQISISHPGVARSVVGGAVYLMLFGIFCLAMGAIVRNTAGGIAAFVGIFFVIPPLLNIFPRSWQNAINPWIPNSAARSIFQLTHSTESLSPAGGLAIFLAYIAAAVVVAAVLLVRRDT
jgi:ABC-2 type transport system permease protein